MADLRTTFAGIKSPNPFWLASAPPTDKAYNVVRAFKAGWGGAVWKTLGEDGRTSHPKVWAGGDCTFGGRDLTVEAVEHGKRAAISVDRILRGASSTPNAPAAPLRRKEPQHG